MNISKQKVDSNSKIGRIKKFFGEMVAVIANVRINNQIGMCGIGYAARQGTSTGFLSITARASHRPNYKIRIRQTDYNRYLTCHPRVQKKFYLPNLVILIEAGFWHTILIDSCNLLYENRKIYYHCENLTTIILCLV